MNGGLSFDIKAIRSLGYEDSLTDEEVFNDWYNDIATEEQQEEFKSLVSKPVQPTLTSPLLQATGPIDYVKDVAGAFMQSAVPTFRSIRTAGKTSKDIMGVTSFPGIDRVSANIMNTMYEMSQIKDSPYFGAYDENTGLRARDDIDYNQLAQDARELQGTRITEEVLHNQKVMNDEISNYMQNNPKYLAHQEYRSQNPLGFPFNAVEVAEWAGVLIPEILPQIVILAKGGPKASYIYNYSRIFGAEIAEDMERNIKAGESPKEAYTKGLVTAGTSTALQSYFENLGLPKWMKKKWGNTATAEYLNSFNYKSKKKVFDAIRRVPGFTKENLKSWSANKWSRVLGGAIKEASTEWVQEVVDTNIDAGMGYGTGQEIFDAMFGEQAKQNFIGGFLAGGAMRAFYTTPEELRFSFDEVIRENSGPIGTDAKNTRVQALKDKADDIAEEKGVLSFAKEEIQDENLVRQAELFQKTLPTKILSDEDYMGAVIKEIEGVSQKLPIKVNEDKLIKPETNASTAELIKKNISAPTHKKLLEVYAKMVKEGKTDNQIFDALNIPKGDKRDSILKAIALQFKRDYGKIDSTKSNPSVKNKLVTEEGIEVSTLNLEESLALIRAKTNDQKKKVIKESISRNFKGEINENELNKLVNATYERYRENSLDKALQIKEEKILKGQQKYIDTAEGKLAQKKEQGALKQNIAVLSKALKPVIIKDPERAWSDLKKLAISPGQHQNVIGVINNLSKSEFKSLLNTVPDLIKAVNDGSIKGEDINADKKIASSILIGQDTPKISESETPPHQREIVSKKSVDSLKEDMIALKEELVEYGMDGDQDGIKATKEKIAALQAKIDGKEPNIVEGTLDGNKAARRRMEADNAKLIADLKAGKTPTKKDLENAGIKAEGKKVIGEIDKLIEKTREITDSSQKLLDDLASDNNVPKQNNNETWEQNEAIADPDTIDEINDMFKDESC